MYSPFDKDLKEICAQDLASLGKTVEGWYVEYKSEVPDASSIAKSISAFANTYGGWLFYGIKEKSKEEAVAGSYPGISRNDVDAALQRIRHAVDTLIAPVAYFDCRPIWGPCLEINLAEDRAIVCIRVPKSFSTPHVHKSGRIYRRVADGSEPKPESDRFILDQLWQRSDQLRSNYRNWIKADPEFSKAEEKRPFLRLLIVADLWGDQDPWLDISLEDVRKIMGEKIGVRATAPFDFVHTTATGFVARQIAGDNAHDLTLTWNFERGLISDILLPISLFDGESPASVADWLKGYNGAEKFAALLSKQKHKHPRIIDFNFVFTLLVAVIEVQSKLLDKANWTTPYYVKSRLLNVWRTSPFLDVPGILNEFEEHGIPLYSNNVITAPHGEGPENFFEIDRHLDVPSLEARILMQAYRMFIPIALAIGLPPWVDAPEGPEGKAYHDQLQDACNRAVEVHRKR